MFFCDKKVINWNVKTFFWIWPWVYIPHFNVNPCCYNLVRKTSYLKIRIKIEYLVYLGNKYIAGAKVKMDFKISVWDRNGKSYDPGKMCRLWKIWIQVIHSFFSKQVTLLRNFAQVPRFT